MEKPIHILHLEDDLNDAEIIRATLESAGIVCEITLTKTANEFKNALQAGQYDIILADYKLPDYDGTSAMRLVKAQYADTPFIFVTGTMGEDIAIQALTEGGADYVFKKKLERLAPAIKRELAFAEIARQRRMAAEKLADSEARYRGLFESAKDGILILNAESGDIVDVNPFLVEMLGYSYEYFLGKPFWKIEAFKDIVANKDKFKELQQKEYVIYENLPLETMDGQKIEVEFISNAYQVNDEKVIQCSIRDISERKQAEDKIKQLSQAVEQSPVSIVITDLEGDIQYVNKKFTEISGYSYEEAIGKNSRILKTDHTSPEEFKELWKTITEGNEWRGNFQNKKKDGTLYWEFTTISPIKNAQDQMTLYIAIKEDITEKIKTEEEIRRNQTYIRSLFEASLDSLVTINADGKLMDVNEAFVTITGLPREEIIGTDFENYFIEPKKAEAGYQQVFEKGFVKDYLLTIRNINDSLTEVLFNASVYKDDADNVIGVFAAARDISGHKLALQYARRLIEASIDPFMTIDTDGKITDVNFASVKIIGIPRAELIGTDFSNHFTEPEKAQAVYRQAFEKGFVIDYPLTMKIKKGKLIEVLYNASVYTDGKGNKLGIFAAAHDITALKQASHYCRSLIEASIDPLVTISAEGKITDVNEALVKVTGVPREELIGTGFSNYFTEPEKAQAGNRQVFENGFVANYPLTIKDKNGNLTDVSYNASVYKDDKGNVIGVFAAVRDIKVLKQLDDKEIAEREKESLGTEELKKFRDLFLGREVKLIEMEKEIEELKSKISDLNKS